MPASPQVDDLSLLQRWRDGDQEAGNELGQRYFLQIYRFFRSKIPEHAEDLTQRTFLGCAEGRLRAGSRAGFRAYLYGVARKQLLRHFEGRGELKGVEHLGTVSIAELRTSPSRAIAAQQEGAQLVEAMQRIPMDFQIVLELFYWQNMSHAEIADALEVAAGTVKSRLSRGRAMLREQLVHGGGVSPTEAELADRVRAAGDSVEAPAKPGS